MTEEACTVMEGKNWVLMKTMCKIFEEFAETPPHFPGCVSLGHPPPRPQAVVESVAGGQETAGESLAEQTGPCEGLSLSTAGAGGESDLPVSPLPPGRTLPPDRTAGHLSASPSVLPSLSSFVTLSFSCLELLSLFHFYLYTSFFLYFFLDTSIFSPLFYFYHDPLLSFILTVANSDANL